MGDQCAHDLFVGLEILLHPVPGQVAGPRRRAATRFARLAEEPDRVAGGFTLGPRVLISEFALRATGLVQPGSLINYNYRVALRVQD